MTDQPDHRIVDALADDAVRRLAHAYGERVRARDLDAFCALYDRDVTVLDAFEPEPLHGVDAWRTSVATWFGQMRDGETNDALFHELTVVGDGVHAAAHALVRYVVLDDDGAEREGLTNRLTWIVRRDDHDAWRVVHEHTSLTVEPETWKARLV